MKMDRKNAGFFPLAPGKCSRLSGSYWALLYGYEKAKVEPKSYWIAYAILKGYWKAIGKCPNNNKTETQ
jgi:hypothetical protein